MLYYFKERSGSVNPESSDLKIFSYKAGQAHPFSGRESPAAAALPGAAVEGGRAVEGGFEGGSAWLRF